MVTLHGTIQQWPIDRLRPGRAHTRKDKTIFNRIAVIIVETLVVLILPFTAWGSGACCGPTGTCTIVADEETCLSVPGSTYMGDETICSPDPCAGPSGACCLGTGVCKLLTEVRCEADQGTWLGAGTTCSPNPCPSVLTGACCLSGICSSLTYYDCYASGGTYLGDGVSCSPNPCATIPEYDFGNQPRFGLHFGKYTFSQAMPYVRRLFGSADSCWLQEATVDEHGWKPIKNASQIATCQAVALDVGDCHLCGHADCDDGITWDLCCYYFAAPASRTPLASMPYDFLTHDILVGGYDAVPSDSITYKMLRGHRSRGATAMESLLVFVAFKAGYADSSTYAWRVHNENNLKGFWVDSQRNYYAVFDSVSARLHSLCPICRMAISFSYPSLIHGSTDSTLAESWWVETSHHTNDIDIVDLHYYDRSIEMNQMLDWPDSLTLDRWKRMIPDAEYISLETGILDTSYAAAPARIGGSLQKQARDLPRLLTLMFWAGWHRISFYLVDTNYGKPEIHPHNALLDDDGSTKPAFFAYRTMIRKVDRFKSVTKMTTGQFRYNFSDGRSPVWLVWSGNFPLSRFGNFVRVTNAVGDSYIACSSNVTITEGEPVWIEDWPRATEERQGY